MEQYVNDAIGVLASDIDSSTDTIVLNDASFFPSIPVFRIRIDDELMKVVDVFGSTFIVERGDEYTTTASHLATTTVKGVLTSASLQQLVKTRMSVDSYSGGLDPYSKEIHLDTTSICMFFSANESIRPYGPIFRLSPVGVVSFTDFGSPDVAGGSGYQLVCGASMGSTRIVGKSVAFSTGTVTACFLRGQVLKHASGLCFGVRNSSDEKMTHMRLTSPDDYSTKLTITNSDGGTHTDVFDTRIHDNNLIWLRIQNDGTDQIFWVSFDGQIWTQIATYGNTVFHGGTDEAFWGIYYDDTTTVPIQATLLSWEQ